MEAKSVADVFGKFFFIGNWFVFEHSCTFLKIIREVYGEKNFACSATKATAIMNGIFEPMILRSVLSIQ